MAFVLFALALAAFAIGTTEFAPMGMLPVIADGIHVSIPSAGLLVSAYAIGVMIGAVVANATPAFIAAMLVLTGIGFTIGNTVSGKLSDKWPRGTLLGCFTLLAVSMCLFPLFARSEIGVATVLLIWGAASFGLVPPLQTRVMQEAHDAPGLASSVNIGAFNLGNALGAAAGSLVIDAGLGYAWVTPVGALLAVMGFGLVWLTPSSVSAFPSVLPEPR